MCIVFFLFGRVVPYDCFFFFFQAEDGIRDYKVTGVQTCALPICFFVCAMIAEGEPDGPTRAAYKALGYRLLATEGFFVQRMKRIPRPPSPVSIERVRTPDLAAQLGKITRTRPISNNLLGDGAPFRQYVALDGQDIVGRVRSVDAVGATWCADMYVQPSHRRRGIGKALLSKMLRDDRAHGSKCSVLTASHTGALLYPHVGYERIGTLFMFAPRREAQPTKPSDR